MEFSLTDLFIEKSSTFNKSLNLIGFMGDKRVNFGKKIIFSDTIRLMKLILFIHVYDIILYINCVFCCGQVRTLAAMTTFFIKFSALQLPRHVPDVAWEQNYVNTFSW